MIEKVFPGDSITAYWALADHWSNTVNAGMPGQDTAAILARMDGLLAAYPKAVAFVILAGTNDQPIAYDVAVLNIETMAQKCKIAGIPFILCQVPARAWSMAALNEKLIAMCAANGWPAPIDYFSVTSLSYDSQNLALFRDSTHPNAAGNAAMVDELNFAALANYGIRLSSNAVTHDDIANLVTMIGENGAVARKLLEELSAWHAEGPAGLIIASIERSALLGVEAIETSSRGFSRAVARAAEANTRA